MCYFGNAFSNRLDYHVTLDYKSVFGKLSKVICLVRRFIANKNAFQ